MVAFVAFNIYHMVVVQGDCYIMMSLFKQEKREQAVIVRRKNHIHTEAEKG
jgi:lipoprotein signal peptidase